MAEQKQYTIEELKEKLIKQFDKDKINYGTNLSGYVDDLFIDVFKSVVDVVKELGINIRE